MNRQDMMYRPEIYDRPMFQTPQTRQGGGIMAGVAPVQGFEDGGLVAEDFFSMEQTEQGSGMNLRDLTNVIFDPSDPLDYMTMGLLSFPPAYAAAKLMKAGVKGSKLVNQMEKFDTLKDAAGTGAKSAGAFEGVRLAGEVPRLFEDEEPQFSDEVMEVASAISNLRQKPDADAIRARVAESYGDDFAAQVMAAQGFANGGIASIVPSFAGGSLGGVLIDSILFLKKSGGPWIEKTLDALKRGEIDAEDARSLDLPEDLIQGTAGIKGGIDDMGGVLSPANVRRAGDDVEEVVEDLDLPDLAEYGTPQQTDMVGGLPDLIDYGTPQARKYLPVLSDKAVEGGTQTTRRSRRAKKEDQPATQEEQLLLPAPPPKKGFLDVDGRIAAGSAAAGRGIKSLGQGALGVAGRNKALTTVGGVAGLGVLLPNFFGDDEEAVDQAAIDAQAAAAAQAAADAEASITEPPPKPPEPSFLSKAGDVVGGLLADKKLRAGLIRASKPTEGFVPRSFAADVYEGGRDYEIEQAKIDRLKAADQTQFQANFEFLKEKFPEKTNEDIREIALSLNSKSKNATAISTLFKALSDDPANAGKPATELWNQATMLVTGKQSQELIDPITGDVINLTEEEAAAAS